MFLKPTKPSKAVTVLLMFSRSISLFSSQSSFGARSELSMLIGNAPVEPGE